MNQNNNNNNPNNGKYGWTVWLVIAACFASGLWPVALIILFFKLFAPDVKKSERRTAPPLKRETKDPVEEREQQRENDSSSRKAASKAVRSAFKTPGDKASSALSICGGITAFIGALLTTVALADAANTPLSVVLFCLSILLGGGAMIFSAVKSKQAARRYVKYLAIIGTNEAVNISTIAMKAEVTEKRAMKDLQNMIDKGMLGSTAYLNKELGYLFMSTQADDELRKAKAAAEMKARQAAVKKEAESYDDILQQIRDINAQIPDPVMTEKIESIENITRDIFKAIERDPSKRRKADRFMSYFLPTTLKLLDSYKNLQDASVEGENISGSKQSIELAMDTIVDGFKKQLDDLYKSDAFNIDAEIDAMTKMMNSDNSGLHTLHKAKHKKETQTASGSIDLGGSAAQTK